MEQHPVPQQISSYQFRLVGDMTLKQFFQLAGGLLISLLFYASNLPGFIKWPFILIFAAAGAALAFVPFQDRPLEQWIIAFFRAIYTPTAFAWKKSSVPETYFKEETAAPPPGATSFTSTDETIIKQAQTPVNQKAPFLSTLEGAEKSFLSRVTQMFGTKAAPQEVNAGVITENYKEPETKHETPKPGPSIPRQEEQVQQQKVTITPRVEENPITGAAIATFPGEAPTSKVSPTLTPGKLGVSQAAQFAETAAPSPPTIPNTIVGQVLDPFGKLVEGAILEIKDSMGRPVRALKSNKLGHFLIVTPLMPGKYTIITEKEGFEFDNVSFEAANAIIPPILIKAKQNKDYMQTQTSNTPRFVSTELP